MAEQSTHRWQSDGVETTSDSEHRCGQRLLRLLQDENPCNHLSGIGRGEPGRQQPGMGQSRGSRVCAKSPAPGQCHRVERAGAGGDGATRDEKTGPSAGFPECYLLLLKINDALERFHFVSLTARPLHQSGRRIRHHSRLLLSPSSLCCSPPPKASQLISCPISTEIYSRSLPIACLTLLVLFL